MWEAFQPGDLAFPPISAPTRRTRPLSFFFSPSGNTPTSKPPQPPVEAVWHPGGAGGDGEGPGRPRSAAMPGRDEAQVKAKGKATAKAAARPEAEAEAEAAGPPRVAASWKEW